MRGFVRVIINLICLILLAGLAAVVLIHAAPGFGTDERELDARLSAESLASLRQHAPSGNPVLLYGEYLASAARGDIGTSSMFGRPVLDLFRERASLTASLAAGGLGSGWLFAFLLAAGRSIRRDRISRMAGPLLCGLLLCVPSALLAFLVVMARAPAYFAITGAVLPRVFQYASNLFRAGEDLPHVTCARAKGLPRWRVFAFHILPTSLPELIALAGSSVAIAAGATIPAEVLCDLPGIGQLAWKAALGRDLYLLVNVTILLTTITLTANAFADAALLHCRRHSA